METKTWWYYITDTDKHKPKEELEMLDKLEQIRAEGFDRISGAPDREKLEMIRKELTGKKSSLQEVLKSLGGLDPDMRKSVGMKANEVKSLFAEKIRQKE